MRGAALPSRDAVAGDGLCVSLGRKDGFLQEIDADGKG
jgi:hypothetical protein